MFKKCMGVDGILLGVPKGLTNSSSTSSLRSGVTAFIDGAGELGIGDKSCGIGISGDKSDDPIGASGDVLSLVS